MYYNHPTASNRGFQRRRYIKHTTFKCKWRTLPPATQTVGYRHGARLARPVLVRQVERFYRVPSIILNLLALPKTLTFKDYKPTSFEFMIELKQITRVLSSC